MESEGQGSAAAGAHGADSGALGVPGKGASVEGGPGPGGKAGGALRGRRAPGGLRQLAWAKGQGLEPRGRRRVLTRRLHRCRTTRSGEVPSTCWRERSSARTPCSAAACMTMPPQPQPTSSSRIPGFRPSFVETSSYLVAWAVSSEASASG